MGGGVKYNYVTLRWVTNTYANGPFKRVTYNYVDSPFKEVTYSYVDHVDLMVLSIFQKAMIFDPNFSY